MRKKLSIFFGVGGVLFALDQLTKHWIVTSLTRYDTLPVIDGFFQIVRVHNTGGVFGILRNLPQGFTTPFFVVAGLVALGVLFHLLRQTPSERTGVIAALGAIFGGALGNLLDRIRHGHVVDFLDFYIGKYHWPAFNIADASISVSVIYLLWLSFRKQDPFAPSEPSS